MQDITNIMMTGTGSLAICIAWRWAIYEHRRLLASPLRAFLKSRMIAVSLGLFPCLILTLASHPGLLPLHPFVSALSSAAAFLIYSAFEPTRFGFWHHRRIRFIGVALTLFLAIFSSLTLPFGGLVPVIFAGAILSRYQRGSAAIFAGLLEEQRAMREKIASLDGDLNIALLKLSSYQTQGSAPNLSAGEQKYSQLSNLNEYYKEAHDY